MSNSLRMILVVALSLVILPALAMMVLVTNEEQVATSDLIVIATVVSDEELPGIPEWQAGRACVKVEQVLKGSQETALAVIRHPVPPHLPPGMVVMDHGGFTLKAGDRRLFALARTTGGFAIVGGSQGMHQVTDAEKITALIKANPFSVTITRPVAPDYDAKITNRPDTFLPVGPFYFGESASVLITITNNSARDYLVHQTMLEGFLLSERMGGMLTFAQVRPTDTLPGVAVEKVNPVLIKSGQKLQNTIKVACSTPPGWQLLGSETYIMTPVLVRARIFIQPARRQDNEENVAMGYAVASPWALALTGYPLPKLP